MRPEEWLKFLENNPEFHQYTVNWIGGAKIYFKQFFQNEIDIPLTPISMYCSFRYEIQNLLEIMQTDSADHEFFRNFYDILNRFLEKRGQPCLPPSKGEKVPAC